MDKFNGNKNVEILSDITDGDSNPIGYVELLDYMGNDLSVVNAARVSYLGESKGEEKDMDLLRYLVRHHHDSPFEMVQFLFRLNAPLFVTNQIMRHRTFSFNSASRRYTDANFEFYIPHTWRGQDGKNKQVSVEGTITTEAENVSTTVLKASVAEALAVYQGMTEEYGIAREQARMILPQNMMVNFYMRADLRNLLHFIQLRNHSDAQWETQLYAGAIQRLIEPIVPNTIKAYYDYRF